MKLRVLDQYGQWSEPVSRSVVIHIDPPTAAFTHTACPASSGDDEGCTPTGEPVTFDPASTTAPEGSTVSVWEWDFGDGASVVVEDPAATVVTHVYERPGDHLVALRVADQYGQWSAPASELIAVANRPASFEVTSDMGLVAFEDEPTTFTAVVDDPDGDPALAEVTWRFADTPPVEATGYTTTYTWDTPGMKEVEVTVVDEAGVPTRCRGRGPRAAGPVADFGWQCPFFGRCNTFAETGFVDASTDEQAPIVAWEWTLGDGGTSTAQHPKHRYKRPGSYDVTLTVTDARGKQATATRTITTLLALS